MAALEDRWFRRDGTPKPRNGKGDRWRVQWRDQAGVAHSESFARKADAVRFRHDVESRLDRNVFDDPSRGKITFGEVADSWWAAHATTLAAGTVRSYRGILDLRVLPRWGRYPVQSIQYADLAGWVAELVGLGLSGARVRNHMIVVSQIFDHAVRDGRISSNPCRLVKRPRPATARRHRYLTASQLDHLADAAGVYRPLILVLGYCGLRWGEAVALRPEDLDRAKGRIHVERAMDPDGTFHQPKDHDRREVPIPDFVLDELVPTMPASGLIFQSPQGSFIHHSNWTRRHWEPALDGAGLPRMRIHELRHTAASLAVGSGATVLAVSRMLGHADPAITLRVYADLFDQDLDDVRARMDVIAREARQARLSAPNVIDLGAHRAEG